MITSEDIETADGAYRTIGRALGRDSTMRELHAAVCAEADMDFDACDNYVRSLVIMLSNNMRLSNERKDQVAIVVRHALCVGASAARKDEQRD